jgi:hypothetical protein
MKSFVLYTKEYYSDGVSCEYEDLIWADDFDTAKFKAEVKINLRNQHLHKSGKCYFVQLSENK